MLPCLCYCFPIYFSLTHTAALHFGRMWNGVLYLWIHMRKLFSFNQNVGRVLLERTNSCFNINFVMLIWRILMRMAYTSSYGDLVNEYHIPLMRIFEIFHATLSWVGRAWRAAQAPVDLVQRAGPSQRSRRASARALRSNNPTASFSATGGGNSRVSGSSFGQLPHHTATP